MGARAGGPRRGRTKGVRGMKVVLALAGEELQPTGSVDISQYECSASGGTVVFTETGGTAIGPYPGTYTETITLTTGPLTQGAPLYQGGEAFYGTLTSAT